MKSTAHLQTMEKHVQSFKKIGIKLYEELCSQEVPIVIVLRVKND